MRRADRLFDVLQILRRKKIATAAELADELEVSPRTIYRDIADMMARGVPVEGEAGVGYVLRPGFDLPPLMFDRTQLEALLLGARIVQSWADPELAQAAGDVLASVRQMVPQDLRHHLDTLTLWAPDDHHSEPISIDQVALRRAMREQRKVRLTYADADGRKTERTVRPLVMAFYGPVWLLATWCELRKGFRVFRLDRISELQVFDTFFAAEKGKTAFDFLKQDALRTDKPAAYP